MSIRLKSYFSGTVEAAMTLARKELGEDAMLIHSRPAQPEVRHLGTYEVVFGVYPGAEEAAELLPAQPEQRRELQREVPVAQAPAQPNSLTQQDSLAQQVAVLRQEMERMMQALVQQNSPGSRQVIDLLDSGEVEEEPMLPAHSGLDRSAKESSLAESAEETKYRLLVEQELNPSLAREVSLGKRLEDAFEVNATLGREGTGKVIVALVGPPGSGKTTTVAKLAARYGLLARKKVHLLSIDVLRIGASDQLRTLASLLGIGFGFAETPADLDRMIEEQYKKDLILIDTPGLGKADMEDAMELAQMIGSDPDIDTHLVLPASMKAEDLAHQVDQFRAFHPHKLIFTRMDESSRYGSLVSLAAGTSLPISFLTQGQRIPDDLQPATKEHLLDLVGIVPTEARPALGMGAAA